MTVCGTSCRGPVDREVISQRLDVMISEVFSSLGFLPLHPVFGELEQNACPSVCLSIPHSTEEVVRMA